MILVDTHVHLYRAEDLDFALEAVRDHFGRVESIGQGKAGGPQWAVCLLESEPYGTFEILSRPQSNEDSTHRPRLWQVETTTEELCLKARRISGERITVFGGRQFVTSERLEVLSLGATPDLSPRRSLIATVEAIRRQDGIPVVPWSPGKWLGTRGKIVAELVQQQRDSSVFYLGDICSRPDLPAWPSPFRQARKRGIRILAGSDPLPVPHGYRKAGRYATALEGPSEGSLTLKQFKSLLNEPARPIRAVGERLQLFEFLLEQASLRLRRWRRRSTGPLSAPADGRTPGHPL